MIACLRTEHRTTTWLSSIRRVAGYATAAVRHRTPKATVKTNDLLHISYGSDALVAVRSRTLLRSILRESGRLPDPNARQYVKHNALASARKLAHKVWENRNNAAFGPRLNHVLNESAVQRNRLIRANDGDLKMMMKIMRRTYGRIGERRYTLLRPLMPTVDGKEIQAILDKCAADAEKDALDDDLHVYGASNELKEDIVPQAVRIGKEEDGTMTKYEATQEGESVPTLSSDPILSKKVKLPELSPQLRALALSQKMRSPPNWRSKNTKHLQPQIPELNAALRPMPQKRVNNLHHKWYAETLNSIQPPLPTAEWKQLAMWARGINMPDVSGARRGSRVVANRGHFGGHSALEAIVVQGRIDMRIFPAEGAHAITPRLMQRVWRQIFSECPRLDWDDHTQQWR